MADYSIFSQMKGPDIDVNLIPNAMRTGAQVGQMTPSPLTSAIKGGIEGVQTGLGIVQDVQTIQANQAKLDSIPLEKQALQADIDYRRAATEDLKSQTAQEDPRAQADRLKLQQAERAVAEENQLISEYQSLGQNPQAQGQMLKSGKYDRHFASDPQMFEQMITTTYQRGGLTQAEYDNLSRNAQKKKIVSQYEQDLEKKSSELMQSAPLWEANPVRNALEDQIKDQNPDDSLIGAEFVASGTFPIVTEKVKGSATGIQKKGERVTDPTADPALSPPVSRDLVDIFAKNGQFIATVSKEDAEQAKRYRSLRSAVSGLSMQRDIQSVDSKPAKPTAEVAAEGQETGAAPAQAKPAEAAKRSEPTFKQAFQLPKDHPFRTQVVKDGLRVSDDVLQSNGFNAEQFIDDVQAIGKYSVSIKENPYAKPLEVEPLKRSAEASVRDILSAQGLKDERSTEIGRELYSPETIAEFQKELDTFRSGVMPRSFMNPNPRIELPNGEYMSYDDLNSIQTAEDLYYIRNKDSIDKQAKLFVNKSIEAAQEYYRAPIEGQKKAREIRDDLSSLANPNVRLPKAPQTAATPPATPTATPQATPEGEPLPEEGGGIEMSAQDVALNLRPGQEQKMAPFADLINRYAAENGVPPNLIASVIWQESRGNPNAVGPYLKKYKTSARGLMQFLPTTFKEMGYDDPFSPEQSIAAGSKYLANLWKRYGSVDLALAAYNWGMGNLDKYRRGEIGQMPEQTSNYVRKITADFNKRNQQGAPSAQTA